MTTLPVEAKALAFARDMVAVIRDQKISVFGMELSWFDKGDNRRLARQIMKSWAHHDPTQQAVADWARSGWDLADEALRELIIEFSDRREPLPTYLSAYSMDVARGGFRRPRGRKKSDHVLRDIAITMMVAAVIERFGLDATGRSPRRCSASSIVAEALGEANIARSYQAVAAIWSRYGRICFPRLCSMA
jgi:hypothetical protein